MLMSSFSKKLSTLSELVGISEFEALDVAIPEKLEDIERWIIEEKTGKTRIRKTLLRMK